MSLLRLTPFRRRLNRPRPPAPSLAVCLGILLGGQPWNTLAGPPPSLPAQVDFNQHIRPLLVKHCFACHGGLKQAGGLSFLDATRAFAETDSGSPAIVAGQPEQSELVTRITSGDPLDRMPPPEHGPPLTPREQALLTRWIRQGAVWPPHWAYTPPQQHASPTVSHPAWVRQPIDSFILARLEQNKLTPASEAPREEWLRRVSFDLIGLPPTPDQQRHFLLDQRHDAYERVVDRLLASPHFGERWASVWLDLARYADTMGYEKDLHRDIWPYRDWLIRALNADLPYDQFLVQQLAGDLLPEATLDHRLATAFHRNTPCNTEAGTDDEEFRIQAVLDRTNTTWQVFAGVTFACAQCHDHPYEPIRQKEYYEFFALLNTCRDANLDEELPLLSWPLEADHQPQAAALDQEITQLQQQLHTTMVPLAEAPTAWHPITWQEAESTGQTQLTCRLDPVAQVPEVITSGTVTAQSKFTLGGPVPAELSRMTALRIDALPHDLEQARRLPELGFLLTRLRMWLELPSESDGQPSLSRELFFREAYCDEAQPFFAPEESLHDSGAGWSAYTKIDRPHWAVFVLDEPVELPAGAQLRLELKQNRTTIGQLPLVLNRSRYALTGDPRWTQQINDPQHRRRRQRLATAFVARESLPNVEVPILQEQPASCRRTTYLFKRGNWLQKGTAVTPGVPALFPPLAANQPPNRLALADWFVSPNHPLTARVAVNRTWYHLFGRGLVATQDDLGSSGELPSHPELLDDLAVRFRSKMHWSFKQLVRELVLSATYRQEARITTSASARDPDNRFLSRGPRRRLTAEMIRDQALQLAGLLAPQLYGPPVMPPQPEGIWRSVNSSAHWNTSEGPNRYRRAIYTYWKRTSPYPSLELFDTPSREVCTVQRSATNTPLQALVTLNDPVFIECAQHFAQRMAREGGATLDEQITWAYHAATGQEPKPLILQELRRVHTAAHESFSTKTGTASFSGTTAAEFARTMVAHAILNLDTTLTH